MGGYEGHETYQTHFEVGHPRADHLAGGDSAGAEDDGLLMGYGYHRGRDEGQLLLLDAQTCESVATVHLPQRVPMGFHGNWAPTV